MKNKRQIRYGYLIDYDGIEAHKDEILGITGEGIKNGVIDITKVNPEKLSQYINAVRKLDNTIGDPLEDIGKHQLFKMSKSPGVSTKVGSETVDGVAVLKKGELI